MNNKETRGGDPPPQNLNLLSLMHDYNTLVASSVVKPQRRRGKSPIASAVAHPPGEGPINLDGKASAKCASTTISGKASAREETAATKHPPELQHGGKASARDDDHQSGKASADGGLSRSQQQSLCLRAETEATPAARQPPEQHDGKTSVQEER